MFMRSHPARVAVSALGAALFLSACGSDNPSGLDRSLADGSTLGSGVGTSAATRASACSGTLGAITVEFVSVPSGATCALEGTRVQGDVKVARNGSLTATGARVGGNVQAEDAKAVTLLAATTVIGDVQVKRLAVVRVENASIDGNLQIEERGTSLVASGTRIGGDLQVSKAASASIATTFVDGNVQLVENSGALSSTGADVRGNFQVFKNLGGVDLVNNRIAQVFECKENTPAPTGSGNVAGEAKDQCRALVGTGGGTPTTPTPPTTPTEPPPSPTPPTTTASACNGTLGAITVELVSVPVGATCVLEGTRVQGDVKVARDASLSATGARIGGNVQAEDARAVTLLASTTVIGDVQVKRLAAVRVENSTIDGNLQLEEAGASLVASGNRIGGNLQLTKAASATIAGTFVNGDLQLVENSGALTSTGADVRGNFQVFKNLGGVRLVNNRVAQVLECKENVPAPTGSGNVAGEKREQCRAL